MKKLSILFVLALLVTVLTACQGVNTPGTTSPVPETTLPVTDTLPADTTPETTPPPATEAAVEGSDLISRDEAKKIALDHAKVKEADVRDLDIELGRDAGTLHYDVDFEVGGKDYDYEIDAKTGKILRSETPAKSDDKPKEESKKELTAAEARDKALKHAGVKKSDVRDLEVELDRDGGKKHYDISFEKDGYDYEYEIDAETGKILKSEKERD